MFGEFGNELLCYVCECYLYFVCILIIVYFEIEDMVEVVN